MSSCETVGSASDVSLSSDCQMDITVGERESTIAVTWEEKKNKEGERDKQMNGKEKKGKNVSKKWWKSCQ